NYIDIVEAADNVDELIIIAGYKNSNINEIVKKFQNRIKIKAVFNPFYSICGPIISLWRVCNIMKEDDFIIANGDTFYNYKMFNKFSMSKEPEMIQLMISSDHDYTEDDVKVKIDKESRLLNVSKTINKVEADGISTGLIMIKGPGNRLDVINKIQDLVRDEEYLKPGHIWHEIFDILSKEGKTITTIPIEKKNWQEVDNIEDLKILNAKIEKDRMGL
ncbi:hypothetical protein ACFLQQ_05240, partial [Actinomycetota bacterium]